ncbi:N-(5'-phosphoribosyl)anthranilate isomerase 1, chloroplastic isoform X2 [Nicotiana tabacum]|uniref:N-(5'-phosphoribosyl)anthranilate isomerase 1, chloroplastic isoform X2 n=1 Tax=Nicotiana tabacum TaxID=4097 RepID=A0AC58UFK7_TOBAC
MLSVFNVGTQLQPRVIGIRRSQGLLSVEVYSANRTRLKTSARNRLMCTLNQSAGVSAQAEQIKSRTLVKMCGITSARDAALAAEAGANFIGGELSFSPSLISCFQFLKIHMLQIEQLHGNGSRDAFPVLVREKRVIYVLHANEEGGLLNYISDEESSLVDWVLVDSAKGGSGKGFNWAQFKLPPIRSKHGWLLAGGINPENVCEALSALKPNGVDVSSGICGQDGIQKDESRILSFMNAVKSVRL